jgi:CO/xanthine dehydrogenase FAD-binding subunit
LQAFDFISAHSLEQVLSLLSLYGENARLLSGGTDLIVQMRSGLRRAELLVDIKPVPELNLLSYDSLQGLTIGAAVSCARLCSDPLVRQHYPGLVEAVALIGGASPAADSPPALIVHEAVCFIAGPNGYHRVVVEDFCTAPGQTILQDGELLVSLHLPPGRARSGSSYLRFTPRSEMDIAVVGAGAALTLGEDGRTIESARIALGAVAPTPLLVPEAGEFLTGKTASPETFTQAARLAQQAARPISDLRGTSSFRKHLCAVLVRRALERALERAKIT